MAAQDELDGMLGRNADTFAALAPVIREKVLTGLESLTGNRPALAEVSFSVADTTGLEAEFASLGHVGIELALTLPSGEPVAGALLLGLPDLGALLSIETSAERMEDADFAHAQLELVSASSREFFDLLSMTLFVDELQGLEVVPSGARLGDAEQTVAMVAETAGGDPVIRLDVRLDLPGGTSAGLTLLLPRLVMDAVGVASAFESLDEPLAFGRIERASAAAASEDGDGDAADGPFGLDSDVDNISPLRPAGTFGAGARDDVDVHPVRFPPLGDANALAAERRSLDLIMDVSMRVTVELGRSTLTVEEVLSLGPGSIVELNKLAGEPVDVLVNEQLVARGEVVVVDENFGVRVTEIVSPRRRAQAMGA